MKHSITYTDADGNLRRRTYNLNPEATSYVSGNPMGPVGKLTITRARLLACGDLWGARSVSVAIQSAIDSAKRLIHWPDYVKAAQPENWRQDEKGVYHLREGADMSLGILDADDFVKRINKWSRSRMAQYGVGRDDNPLGWRVQQSIGEDGEVYDLRKQIDPHNWVPWEEKQGDCKVHNLVHVAHDRALEEWHRIEEAFRGPEASVDLTNLLPHLLAKVGFQDIEPMDVGWTAYQRGLRQRAGFRDFGRKMAKAMAQESDNRHMRVDEAYADLRLALMDLMKEEDGIGCLVDIWYHEIHYPQGNVNNAFRAVLWDGSPVLEALGLSRPESCSFLTADKLNAMVGWCMKGPKPVERLAKLLWNDAEKPAHVMTHERVVFDEEGHGIRISDCPHCLKTAQDALIRGIRSKQSQAMSAPLKALIQELNSQERKTALPAPRAATQPTYEDSYRDLDYGYNDDDWS